MIKKIIVITMALLIVFNLSACDKEKIDESDILQKDFQVLLEEARGTTVTFYGWGGSEQTNSWIDGYLTENVKKDYDIKVKRIGMNIDEILNKLLNEKQLDVEVGDIDVVWINGENFFTARENNILFGPFTDKLRNFGKYIDADSLDTNYDFGYPVEGYEAPYGKAQLVMVYDSDKIKDPPKDHNELLELAKRNPGKITYSAPPDFTGSAFIRNILYDIIGYESFIDLEADEDVVRKVIQPAIDYLKELKPYLWRKGVTYPADIALLNNMYSDGEVWMTIDYHPNAPYGKVLTGEYSDSTRTHIFDNGTIGNTHFLAIPYNAPNKKGAMALIDYILNVESQASKYNPDIWGDLPVLDNEKLSEDEKGVFSSIKLGDATIPQDLLFKSRLPEMSAELIPLIEKIWIEEIPGE